MILVFLALAVVILPEYRYTMLIVLALYSVLLFFILRVTAGEYISEFTGLLFSRRSSFILKALVVSMIIFVSSFMLLNSGLFSGIFYDTSSNGLLSLDSDTRAFLKGLNEDVELIYVRPLKGDDESALFEAMLKEFKTLSKHIGNRTLHPVINATDYEELKSIVPSVLPGSVISMSKRGVSVSDNVTEYKLILSIYRAIEGKHQVCVSYLNGEPSIDDYTENGSAIIAQLMKDRGIDLIPVSIEDIDSCRSLILFEAAQDFNRSQIDKILLYKGTLVILAGKGAVSIKEILSSFGIELGQDIKPEFGLGAFRDYLGAVIVDKISDHPISRALSGTISAESASELNCSDCQLIAGVSSTRGGKSHISPVIVLREGLLVSSLNGLTKNFFMRFKGNAEVLINSVNFLVSSRYPYINSVPKVGIPKIFAISNRYMRIIFVLVVWVLPIFYLLLGIYCFRKNHSR